MNDLDNYYYINRPDSGFFLLLVSLIFLQLFKELCQFVFLDGLSYFISLQNMIEIATYVTSLISLLSRNYYTQSAYGSIAVLFAFILFPLFIQKLKMFGLYVVAFRRTLANSAKFFPIFLIMFTGFILSFRIRSNFGVSYSNSTGYSIIRTFTMFVGELDTAKMGLYNDSITNYLIYFLFIVVMCTIVLNLFVGIAVGEIKTVLDEADIQQISMRIMFVLKVQSAIQPLCENVHCLNNILGMNYKTYSYESEIGLIKIVDTLYTRIIKLIASKEQRINLSDPQKRLEDSFSEMSRLTSEQIKSIKFGFSTQISDVESKLFNSQRRLQDSLNEYSSNAAQQINEFREEVKQLNNKVKVDLSVVQKIIEESISTCIRRTSEEFVYTNKYFNQQLSETEQRFQTQMQRLESFLIEMTKKALFQFESVKECCVSESKNLKSIIISSEKLMEVSMNDMSQQHHLNENLIVDHLLAGLKLDELKQLVNSVLEKTIERFKTNEINFNIQKLQLESMSMSLKNVFLEALVDLKELNATQFQSIKTRSSYLEDKLETIELQLKQCNEMIHHVADALNNSISSSQQN